MSWRSIAEQYYARIAELEAERDKLQEALVNTVWDREQNKRLKAERDRLTAMVMSAQHALDEVGAGIARRVLAEREACMEIAVVHGAMDTAAAIRARPAP